MALALSVALSGLLSPSYAFADSSEFAKAEMEQSILKTSIVASKLTTIQKAISAYYTDKLAWPSSFDDLDGTSGLAEIYYQGSYSTPIGTITGTSATNSYTIRIGVLSNPTDFNLSIYENVAGQVGGDYDSTTNQILLSVPIPHSASIKKNMISRVADTSGFNLNTMETDLHLDSNDILNASKVFGVNANFDTLNTVNVNANSAALDTINADDLLVNVESTITDGTANSISFNSLTVTDTLEADDLNFNALDFDTVNATNAKSLNLIVTDTARATTLNADEVEFKNGNFHNSLNADVAHIQKLVTDSLQADQFITPISFNSHAEINGVMNTLSTLRVDSLHSVSGTASLGQTVLNKDLNSNVATLKSNLNITNSAFADEATFNNNLTVYGRSDFESLVGTSASISNLLRVKGDATITNTLSLNGDLIAGGRVIARNGEWYENGQKIVDKYYGINEKVADADRLGGKDSSQLAVKSRSNVFQRATTFNKNLNVNGSVTSGSGVLFSSSGRLYDQGTLVSSKYATKAELNQADQYINSYLTQVRADVESAINRKRGEIQGYESRINTVLAGQPAINSKIAQVTSNLNTTESNLATAKNYVNSGTSSLNGAKGKISAVEGVADRIASTTAWTTTVNEKTITINKRYR